MLKIIPKRTIEVELPVDLIDKIERVAAFQGRTFDAVVKLGVGIYTDRFRDLDDAEPQEDVLDAGDSI